MNEVNPCIDVTNKQEMIKCLKYLNVSKGTIEYVQSHIPDDTKTLEQSCTNSSSNYWLIILCILPVILCITGTLTFLYYKKSKPVINSTSRTMSDNEHININTTLHNKIKLKILSKVSEDKYELVRKHLELYDVDKVNRIEEFSREDIIIHILYTDIRIEGFISRDLKEYKSRGLYPYFLVMIPDSNQIATNYSDHSIYTIKYNIYNNEIEYVENLTIMFETIRRRNNL